MDAFKFGRINDAVFSIEDSSYDFAAIARQQSDQMKRITFRDPVRVIKEYSDKCELLCPDVEEMTKADCSPFVFDEVCMGFLYTKGWGVSKVVKLSSILKPPRMISPIRDKTPSTYSMKLTKRDLRDLTNLNTHKNTRFKENKIRKKKDSRETWIIKRKSTPYSQPKFPSTSQDVPNTDLNEPEENLEENVKNIKLETDIEFKDEFEKVREEMQTVTPRRTNLKA